MSASEADLAQRREQQAVYAYCRAAAVCLNYVNNRGGQPTVTFDFAPSTGDQRYDWPRKVSFQLTHGELAEFCAYLFFPSEAIRWIHGKDAQSKVFSIEKQSGHLLFSIRRGAVRLNIPVIPTDQFYFRNRVLSRLLAIQPPLDASMHLESLRKLAQDIARRSR